MFQFGKAVVPNSTHRLLLMAIERRCIIPQSLNPLFGLCRMKNLVSEALLTDRAYSISAKFAIITGFYEESFHVV